MGKVLPVSPTFSYEKIKFLRKVRVKWIRKDLLGMTLLDFLRIFKGFSGGIFFMILFDDNEKCLEFILHKKKGYKINNWRRFEFLREELTDASTL